MSGDHDHTVMMRAISTEDDGHTHLVELRCA
jgi:hypothetical protein